MGLQKPKNKNAEGHNAPTLTGDAFDTLRPCPGRSAQGCIPSKFSEGGVTPKEITINPGEFLETIPAPMIFWGLW